MNRFGGKSVIVTGGSSGIGSAIARRFAKEGARVAVVDRSPEKLKAFVEELAKSTGAEVLDVPGNVALEEDNKRAVEMVMKKFGRLDIGVINAGVSKFAKLTEVTCEAMDEVLDVHVKGTAWGVKYMLPAIAKSGDGGSILAISSVDGLHPTKNRAMRGVGVYAAAKAAQNMLVQYAACEGAAHHVRVNAVAPASTKTEIAPPPGQGDWAEMSEEEFDKSVGPWHLLGRGARAEEVAALAGFLASDEASFITGSVVPIDGGFTLKGSS